MRIAFAGNPNSGKTTMFNALTGRNEKVGNWAGVTVDIKEASIKKLYSGGKELVAVDLPGAYSMSPFTSEESITSSYVKKENPDVIINIVDATNLSRSLFFTTQLLELGIPMVVALNKSDVNRKKQNKINVLKLSQLLGCPVIETVSTHNSDKGLAEVVEKALLLYGVKQVAPYVEGNVDLTNKASVVEADKKRFEFVNRIVAQVEKRTTKTNKLNAQDKLDGVLTNKWAGIPIFAVVMYLVFWISQAGPGVWIADTLVGWLESFQEFIRGIVTQAGAAPILQALLVDGIIGGFVAVVGFLPLVMVMYFLIALLEDCGYMARATVVLDPIFKKVGLSGKSVIPFVIGTGCAIPGVMACRTIKNERERRATAMLAPFMPCGAKLPVISLFSTLFFKNATWVGPLMYFAGIVIIFFGALLVNKIAGHKARKSFFIMELPEYKIPGLMRAVKSMCQRGWSYIVKAGTIILMCNTIVQIMQSFDWSMRLVEQGAENTSILATVAQPFAYLLVPVVGVAAWQLAAAAITGFIAKENVVGTIAVCYSVTNFFNLDNLVIEGGVDLVAEKIGISAASALAYLMFNLFSPPCFAAIGAMNAEMKSAKWLWGGIGLQLGTGFTVGYLVYQIGTIITEGRFGEGFVGGLVAIIAFAAILRAMIAKTNKELEEEYGLKNNNKRVLS